MSLIKTPDEIKVLREGGKILGQVLEDVAAKVAAGISTWDLEELARDKIGKAGAEAAFLGYTPSWNKKSFPAALCASINNEVVHCIPSKRILKQGEIISLDLGIKYKNLYTDAAITVPVGKISREVENLLAGTREALHAGIEEIKPGNTIGDVAHAVQAVGKKFGLGVIRDLIGHGVGHSIHEPPSVPNYGKRGTLEELRSGMVLAIEPMFTLGDWRVKFMPDGWTVLTADGSLAAHFEHTVAVIENGHSILTE
ncbi:MAG: type I methionyl aminopeptidase [bacterium]|nr:type I methionyl aminopeptidase [bacterium]